MGYRVEVKNGVTSVLVNSLEEAAELIRLANLPTEVSAAPTRLSEDEAVPTIFRTINENGRKFLAALALHNQGVTGDTFSHETGVPPEKFGGTLGGISKIAKKYGYQLEAFVLSEMRGEGPKRFRFLTPGPLLLRFADYLRERQKMAVVK